MRIFDLSHTIHPGMLTYPGLPGPAVDDHMSFDESQEHYAAGTEFQIKRVELVTSTGTYLDAPRHRFRDGDDISAVGLERCVELPLVVVDVSSAGAIGPDLVPEQVAGCAVVFRSGWDQHWRTARYGSDEHPHLEPDAAGILVERGAYLAGIDSVNVDGTENDERPIHTTLLAGGVLVVENLANLQGLPKHGGRFTAVPLAFADLPSFPVRAYARVP